MSSSCMLSIVLNLYFLYVQYDNIPASIFWTIIISEYYALCGTTYNSKKGVFGFFTLAHTSYLFRMSFSRFNIFFFFFGFFVIFSEFLVSFVKTLISGEMRIKILSDAKLWMVLHCSHQFSFLTGPKHSNLFSFRKKIMKKKNPVSEFWMLKTSLQFIWLRFDAEFRKCYKYSSDFSINWCHNIVCRLVEIIRFNSIGLDDWLHHNSIILHFC